MTRSCARLWVKSGRVQTEQTFSGLCLKAGARRLWLDRFSVFDFFLVQNLQRAGASRLRTADPKTLAMVVGRWSMVGWFEASTIGAKMLPSRDHGHFIDG